MAKNTSVAVQLTDEERGERLLLLTDKVARAGQLQEQASESTKQYNILRKEIDALMLQTGLNEIASEGFVAERKKGTARWIDPIELIEAVKGPKKERARILRACMNVVQEQVKGLLGTSIFTSLLHAADSDQPSLRIRKVKVRA